MQKKYDELSIPREEEIASYYKLRQQLDRMGREMQTFIVSPKYCVPFLQPGRMVKVGDLVCCIKFDLLKPFYNCIKVENGDEDFGWGSVVNFQRKSLSKVTCTQCLCVFY